MYQPNGCVIGPGLYGYGCPRHTLFTAALNGDFASVTVVSDLTGVSLGYHSLFVALPTANPTIGLNATASSYISSFIATGHRALLWGENQNAAAQWSTDLLGLVGGTYAGGAWRRSGGQVRTCSR